MKGNPILGPDWKISSTVREANTCRDDGVPIEGPLKPLSKITPLWYQGV